MSLTGARASQMGHNQVWLCMYISTTDRTGITKPLGHRASPCGVRMTDSMGVSNPVVSTGALTLPARKPYGTGSCAFFFFFFFFFCDPVVKEHAENS